MWWLALNCEMSVLLGLKAVSQNLECIGSLAWVPKDIKLSPNFLLLIWSYNTHYC